MFAEAATMRVGRGLRTAPGEIGFSRKMMRFMYLYHRTTVGKIFR
jgi:hypothetical protein